LVERRYHTTPVKGHNSAWNLNNPQQKLVFKLCWQWFNGRGILFEGSDGAPV